MLTIRPEQLKAFSPQDPEVIASVLFRTARQDHEQVVGQMSDRDLLACVKSAMARGAKYGICDLGPISHFFYLMLSLAPNFDEHPEIQRILKDPQYAQDELVPAVVEETTEETWQDVVERFDAKAWHFGLATRT